MEFRVCVSQGLFGVPELSCPAGFDVATKNTLKNTERLLEKACSCSPGIETVESFDQLSNGLCKVADLVSSTPQIFALNCLHVTETIYPELLRVRLSCSRKVCRRTASASWWEQWICLSVELKRNNANHFAEQVEKVLCQTVLLNMELNLFLVYIRCSCYMCLLVKPNKVGCKAMMKW